MEVVMNTDPMNRTNVGYDATIYGAVEAEGETRPSDMDTICKQCDTLFVDNQAYAVHECSGVIRPLSSKLSAIVNGNEKEKHNSKKQVAKTATKSCKKKAKKVTHPYRCEICAEQFLTKVSLSKHMNTHDDNPLMCKLCHQVFLMEDSMAMHMCRPRSLGQAPKRKAKATPRYKNLLANKIRKVDLHIGDAENDVVGNVVEDQTLVNSKEECAIDSGKELNDKDDEITEFCDADDDDMSIDLEKSATEFSKGNCQFRVKITTKKFPHHTRYHCESCDMWFKEERNLSQHLARVHGDEHPWECVICNSTFSSAKSFKKHVLLSYECRSNVCGTCNKRFSSEHKLKIHELIHSEASFACPYCDKKFTTKGILQRHSRIHTGEKPYKCIVCAVAYNQCSVLKSHCVKQHGDMNWQGVIFGKVLYCNVCKKHLDSIDAYEEHNRSNCDGISDSQ